MFLTDDFDDLTQEDQLFCIENKIAELYENVDLISKKINTFGQPAFDTVDSLTSEQLDLMMDLVEEFNGLIDDLIEHQSSLIIDRFRGNILVNYI